MLIVDDSENDFVLIQTALRSVATRVEAKRVETEAQMRDAMKQGTWDIVLVDWVLPQFDAPSALSLLRSWFSAPPCIVVSGMPGEALAVTSIKLGAADFIPKNDLGYLSAAVARELVLREDISGVGGRRDSGTSPV